MYSQYDKQYGIQKEKEIKPFLVKHFGALSETPPNDIFDFYNEKYVVKYGVSKAIVCIYCD